MKIESFKDGILKIDGQTMSIAEAFKTYPKEVRGIYTFVNNAIREMERQDEILHVENIEKIRQIKGKVKEIFDELDLKNDMTYTQICKIFKYIVTSSSYDDKIFDEKQELYNANISPLEKYKTLEINGIYNCLIENRSDCLGDAVTMSFLLRCLDIDSTYITIGDKNFQNIHSLVRTSLFGHKFYSDPTTVREALQNGITNLDDCKVIMTEKFYKKFLKDNNLKILHVYSPIEFLEDGQKMNFGDEDEKN